MGKSYFQFKQFLINQDQCAMKVCTDACLLGAYTPVPTVSRVLDIGTGTGLLALMLAQRSQAQIDAVEVDHLAAKQALENVNRSPWATQIQVIQQDIRVFANQKPARTYDLIISNPPFFEDHLKSPSKAKNVALHSEDLKFDDLLKIVLQLLNKTGQFFLLLPAYQSEVFSRKASVQGLYLTEKLLVYNRPQTELFRVISTYQRQKPSDCLEKTIYIRDQKNAYSDDFRTLLRDYYLIF